MREFFYCRTTSNLVAGLLDYFSDLLVLRMDSENNVYKEIPVPIKYGLLDKSFLFRKGYNDPKGDKYYLNFPQMTLSISGINPAMDRMASANEIRHLYGNIWKDDYDESVWSNFTPCPVDITFKLQVLTKNTQDFCQIIEQIVPWFVPHEVISFKEFDFLNIERNIQITISGFSTDFQEELGPEEERFVNGNFDILAKAWFYKPIRSGVVIEKIRTEFLVQDYLERYNDNTTETMIIPSKTENIVNALPNIPPDEIPLTPTEEDKGIYYNNGRQKASQGTSGELILTPNPRKKKNEF